MEFVGPWTVHNHCLRHKSQHLRLLFIEQYMNSNRISPKRVKKKKKKAKRRRWNADVLSKLSLCMILYDPPSVVDSLLAFNKAELLYNKLFVANIISMFNQKKKKITD